MQDACDDHSQHSLDHAPIQLDTLNRLTRMNRSSPSGRRSHLRKKKPHDHVYKWIPQVAHVCRLWREIVFSDPQFWTHVDIGCMTPEQAKELIQRSAPFPLAVTLHHIASPNLVLKHKLRVQRLDIPAPMDGAHMPAAFSPVGVISALPNLRAIGLAHATKQIVMSAIRPNLTKLRVNCLVRPFRPSMSIRDWLQILAQLPSLEELELTDAVELVGRVPSSQEPLMYPGAVVNLPHLRQLRLSAAVDRRIDDGGLTNAELLRHLILPSNVNIKFHGEKDRYNGAWNGMQRILGAFTSRRVGGSLVFSDPPLSFQLLNNNVAEGRKATFEMWHTICEMDRLVGGASEVYDGEGKITLSWSTHDSTSWIITPIFQYLPLHAVRTCAFKGELPYHVWPLSIDMRSLVHLGISFLDTESRPSDLPPPRSGGSGGSNDKHMDITFLSSPSIFPNIQRLTLVACRPYRFLCQNISSSLSKRRVKNPSLYFLAFKTRENFLTDQEAMDELERSGVVEKVEWGHVV